MPELPEVQTTVSGLDRVLPGLVIADVWTDYRSLFHAGKDSIKNPAFFSEFKKVVTGAKIIRVTRRAKNILIHIESNGKSKKIKSAGSKPARSVILVHMKMTGHLLYGRFDFNPAKTKDAWTPAADESKAFHDSFNRFIHFALRFEKSGKRQPRVLVLSDMRKFAKVTLIAEAHLEENLEKSLHLAGLGPEPLEKSFTFKLFKERTGRLQNGRIKTVLMDQSVIAGIGNIYSDEALWRSSLNPEERVRDIPDSYLKKLYGNVLTVLRAGIDFGGDSMSDYRNIDGESGKFQEKHNAYRKTGKKCTFKKNGEACTGIIVRKVVGGRSAHFCNVHQRLLAE